MLNSADTLRLRSGDPDVCRSGVMLSCGDGEETGRRRLAGRSPDRVIAEGSRAKLPVWRWGRRTSGSILVLSVRRGPAPGWVESVVIAMLGHKRRVRDAR